MAKRHTCSYLGRDTALSLKPSSVLPRLHRSLRLTGRSKSDPVNTRSLSLSFIIITLLCSLGAERTVMSETKFKEPVAPAADVQKQTKAILHTAKGDITVELYPKEAPLSVTNFVQLAKGGFYNNLTFHRVEPNFVIQGGDPLGTGTGGPGYTIPAELKGNPHQHVAGALAWARTGDQVNPERRSSGSQFYITLAPTPFLDNAYTVFGRVTSGMEVAKKITRGDKILSIEIPQ